MSDIDDSHRILQYLIYNYLCLFHDIFCFSFLFRPMRSSPVQQNLAELRQVRKEATVGRRVCVTQGSLTSWSYDFEISNKLLRQRAFS